MSSDEAPEQVSDKKSPGFWFFPADFERDVLILSLSAQGLWMRLLCWMSDNESHRGFAELPTGAPMTLDDIAARVGKKKPEVTKAIDEMEHIGIFSRDDRGCIYCRRMARDTHISSVRSAAAKSRADTAARAANGKFAGNVYPPLLKLAGGFVPPKQPPKTQQNPTVPVPVSDPDSDSVQPKSYGGGGCEFPLTLAEIRKHDPATDYIFINKLATTTIQACLSSSEFPDEKVSDVTDTTLSQAVRTSYETGPPSHGKGLLLNRVPSIVITWGAKTYGNSKPEECSCGHRGTCKVCHAVS